MPLADLGILAEAALLLGLSRLAVAALPFRLVARAFGRHRASASGAPAEDTRRRLARVRWAVESAAARVPWSAPCLPQAMAAKAMLRARGVPSTLCLGLRRDEPTGLQAHAWLEAGEAIVTGQRQRRQFTEVARFA
jgi:Transglutaminase-like superfamily